ncbi:crotonase/enoyl-CoA hydratase family protein [Ponticaulis profundi]|uniref:Crotonase/enoyl-CoA hydratase family protein n=1 Tax=Ponticaulis profundi TaxID=2665222 RepID=A0ABW1SB88_9PROT
MSERITVDIKDGIADVKLVRTDKMNALDDAMFEALVSTAEKLNSEKSVRCVVLSGEGRAFCAGLDMGNFAKMASAGSDKSEKSSATSSESLATRTYGIANRAQQAAWGWRQLRVPVINAAHGVAFGGGFQVFLGSDIRIAHPETKLCIMEVKWGLIPDMALTPIVRNLVREDILRELTYTGRIFTAVEGKEYGFVTHLSETPYDDAMALAKTIASQSPDSVQAAKRLYNQLPDATEAETLLAESTIQLEIMGKPNQIEAAMAGLEKRPANFKD